MGAGSVQPFTAREKKIVPEPMATSTMPIKCIEFKSAIRPMSATARQPKARKFFLKIMGYLFLDTTFHFNPPIFRLSRSRIVDFKRQLNIGLYFNLNFATIYL